MNHPEPVTDIRSNPNEQIAHAASLLKGGRYRRLIFQLIYKGKKQTKLVSELAVKASMSRVRVLQEGKSLSSNGIVKQVKIGGETAYEKDAFFAQNKKKILALAANKDRLKSFPTKYNPKLNPGRTLTLRVPRRFIRIKQVTVDDIDSFSRIRSLRRDNAESPTPIAEGRFKAGIKAIIGESGHFRDWGGEKNDLLTTRVRINGRRMATAFAFKGKGQTGILTPRLMGKNGDQIQRLFGSAADVFLLQYWGQISESVPEQMRAFASLNSIHYGKTILWGTIDGQDTLRLVRAYPSRFR